MNTKGLLIALLMLTLGANALMSQVTFTQTTTSDFERGTCQNLIVDNDSVFHQSRMRSFDDWLPTTNLPLALSNFQTATWRDNAYLIGGRTGSDFSSCVNSVYRTIRQTAGVSSWISQNPLPISSCDMAVAATQTQLIVMGGRNSAGASQTIYSASFNSDGSIGTWAESSVSLPSPNWGGTAVVVHDQIFLIGGAGTENTATNKVYRLNINASGEVGSVSEVASLPEARNGHAATTYGSKIFVTGGYDENGVQKPTVFCTTVNPDGSLDSWQETTDLPTSISNHACVCTNGALIVIGGKEGTLASNKLYYANANDETLTWTLSDYILSDRLQSGAAFAFNGQIVFCGGIKLTGATVNYVRYATMSLQNAVEKATFVSSPFAVGSSKEFSQLSWNINCSPIHSSYEMFYRIADNSGTYGNWISAGSSGYVEIGQSGCYFQYMLKSNTTNNYNVALQDVTLTVSGYTVLSGSLDNVDTLKLANSPYYVTNDISFNNGNHVIEAGVIMNFGPNTGLTIGHASVDFNGTESDPITLTYYDDEPGHWNGVYFQDASDNGVTSTLTYTTIEKAGNGDNGANLRLYNTNQPTIENCFFDNADGFGLRLENSSPIISSSVISNNTSSGLFLSNSNPSVTNTTISGNGYAGIYNANGVIPEFTSCLVSGNTFGIYSYTPNASFHYSPDALAMSANGTDIAMAGGTISNDCNWKYFPNGYALLGSVTISGRTCPKLTIAPKNTIKVETGKRIIVGGNGSTGGMLNAIGRADSLITFTSYNGEIGGWEGFYFDDGSDYNSSSNMRYCVVENGNNYNISCFNTSQPQVLYSTIQNVSGTAVYMNASSISIEESTIKNGQVGIEVNNASPSLLLVTLDNFGEECVKYVGDGNLYCYSCTFKNTRYGILFPSPEFSISSLKNDNVVFQNTEANLAVMGGRMESNRTWGANEYAILGSITIGQQAYYYNSNHNRLTVKPGTTLKFDTNCELAIGGYYNSSYRYYGDLYAVGTPDSLITFTSLNGETGGWNGINFTIYSDDFSGAESIVKHCVVENGNSYNMSTDGTTLPIIENCVFQHSNNYGLKMTSEYNRIIYDAVFADNASHGLYTENTSMTLHNCTAQRNGDCGACAASGALHAESCQFVNNTGYGLYFTNADAIGLLTDLHFEGNLMNGAVVAGGRVENDRTWKPFGEDPYVILGSITIGQQAYYYNSNHNRLTVKPGTTLKFDTNCELTIGGYSNSSYRYYGDLYAVGTPDSLITFTSLNGETGGWNGIYFTGYSDDFSGASSLLQHCVVENGNSYNVSCEATSQPAINNSIFRKSNGYGLRLSGGASNQLKRTSICYNQTHGLYVVGNGMPQIGTDSESGCDIYGNGGYGIYHDGTSALSLPYSYWGTGDSTLVDNRFVYDFMDNNSKGRVNFMPVSNMPRCIIDTVNITGTVLYNNDATMPLSGILKVSDFDGTLLGQSQVASDGTFSIPDLPMVAAGIMELPQAASMSGVNGTDALLTMLHYAHIDTLSMAQQYAADVNSSGTVNGTDALLIMQRFVGLIPSFPAGELSKSFDTIRYESDNVSYNISVLWFGDVNGSYSPEGRSSNITLESDGYLAVNSNESIDIPIKAKGNYQLGAVSLTLEYPEEFIAIEDVILSATGEHVLFSDRNGVLTLTWCDLEPIDLANDEQLLAVKARTKDISMMNEPFSFSLSNQSELADGTAQIYNEAVLTMPTLSNMFLEIAENTHNDDMPLSVYPNPMNEECTIAYSLSSDSHVMVALYNIIGVKLDILTDGYQSSGRHELLLNRGNLSPGIYYLHFSYDGESRNNRIIKIVIE